MNGEDIMEAPDAEPEELFGQGRTSAVAVTGGLTRSMVADLQKAAASADQIRDLIQTVCVRCTYESDWTVIGSGTKARACLGSAGACRIAAVIGDIRIEERRPAEKITFSDRHGEGYIWTYYVRGRWGARVMDAEGSYSSRDKFLGKDGDNFRDPADINEADIRRAARHIATGEVIKELIGLRAIPPDVLSRAGHKLDDVATVTHADSGEGQLSDRDKRREICDACLKIAGGDQAKAREVLVEMTQFTGRDGKTVRGVSSTDALKGKRLEVTWEKARKAAGNG